MDNTPDLGSIISTLSSNPALMTMISELMKSSAQPQPPSPTPPPAPTQNASPIAANAANHGISGINPELISMITSMLGQTTPSDQQSSGNAQNGNAEPHQPSRESNDNVLSKLLGGKAESENRIRLLNALRPYLSEDRREKLDLILKLLQLSELGHLSGLLRSL